MTLTILPCTLCVKAEGQEVLIDGISVRSLLKLQQYFTSADENVVGRPEDNCRNRPKVRFLPTADLLR